MFKWASGLNPKPSRSKWSIRGVFGKPDDDSDRAQRIEDAKRGIIRVGRM